MRLLVGILAFLLISPVFAGDVWVNGYSGDVWVNGYYRSDGTYVRPHYRSAPDGNVWNNWSTRGNINPYTGKPGYKDPFKEMQRRNYRSYGSSFGNIWGKPKRYIPRSFNLFK